MAAKQEPNIGLNYGWGLGESGWNLQMDENLRAVGALVQVGVVSMTTSTPPASPSQGARYIVGPAATGAWAGHTGKLVRYLGTDWEVYAPSAGWLVFDEDTGALHQFTASGWEPVTATVTTGATGTAIKFASGVMLCFASLSQAVQINTADGTGFKVGSFTHPFPEAFTAPPVVSGTAWSATASPVCVPEAGSATDWGMRMLAVNDVANTTYDIKLFAVGRWK